MSEAVSSDYETRSRCDLKACGAYKYSEDPSTEVFMCAVSALDSDETYLWINEKFPVPAKYAGQNAKAEKLLAEAKLRYAFSVQFEIALTWGTLKRGAPCPFKVEPPLESWRDTAALARKAGLPGDLGRLSEALNLTTQKDRRGKALIKFFSEPCTTGKNKGNFNEPKDHPEKWELFCDYCVTDVAAEKGAQKKLKAFELTGAALDTYLFDLRMNREGIPVNRKALVNAQKIIDDVQERVGTEFRKLTGLNPTQRDAVKGWFASQGLVLPNMKADTLDELELPGEKEPNVDLSTCTKEAKRAMELYRKLAYAAIKKVKTMLAWACDDDQMRGTFRYYGAGTGRWSANGPQPHNAKKATPEIRPMTQELYAAIERGISAEAIDCIYGEPLEVISCCIRHFIHSPGQEMLDGDYNAIEARIACWLAGQHDAVQEYRLEDAAPKEKKWVMSRYVLMAADIYDKSPARVTADEREVGKRAILGLGYGMGTAKFRSSSLEQYGIDLSEELAERAKVKFRQKHDKIQKFWYLLDENMRQAIAFPGTQRGLFHVRTVAGIPYLLGKLPSGRSLAFPYPKIEDGDAGRTQITYWGQIPLSTQWGRIKLYGAKVFENFCQAIAADIMAHGSLVAEQRGMRPFALIHDQGLALCTDGQTGDDFAAALAALPAWAKGLPLKVEAKRCKFYSK